MNILEYISVSKDEKPLDRMVTDGGYCAIFRTIACIGDSLSSGEFESVDGNGKKHFHDFYDYSWGQFIGRLTGAKVYNFSRGGMTAKEYVEEFADSKGFWGTDKLCQAYIIAMGVNDAIIQGQEIGSTADVCKEDYTKNKATFAGYYAQIIQRIKKIQPRAKIFLVTTPKNLDKNDERRARMRDLLDDFTKFFDGTYLIDLYTYCSQHDEEFARKFKLGHMNPMGYVLTARMIESYIDYIIRHNPEDFAQVGFIGTELYYRTETEGASEK